jgi:hypothetical protein
MKRRRFKPLPAAERLRELFHYDPDSGMLLMTGRDPIKRTHGGSTSA